MEAYEATRMVYSRLQKIDPEHASKVMGYLLLKDEGDQELFRLAFSHESVLQAMVLKVKKELGLTSRNPNLVQSAAGQHFSSSSYQLGSPSPVTIPIGNDHFNNISSFSNEQDDRNPLHAMDLPFFNGPDNHAQLRFNNRFLYQDPQLPALERFPDHLLRSDMQLADHLSFLNEPHDPPYYPPDFLQPDAFNILNGKLGPDNFQPRFTGRRFSTSDLPMSPDSFGSAGAAWKPCLYFARGFCKHGSNCKFLHTHMRPDSGFLLSPNNGQHDSGSDDGILTGTLERLEFELQELLRGRKAPISIASLPQLYYERFGKTLQADGYLTESQRHGKAGYSLTKLLARLKNSVTLIDRPHGQHAVVLAEDAVKFNAYRGEKEELNPGSRQIYLTFPADSAFTEEDVSAYFRVYGPVQDVRIPFQQKRMFGFVTFVYPETVKMILAKGNPHYICGARVLVKPYKEKGKHADRKFADRDYLRFMAGQSLENRAYEGISGPRFFMEHDSIRKQLEEQEMIVEMERRRLAELQLQKQRRQQLHMQHEPASSLSEGGSSSPPIALPPPSSSSLAEPASMQQLSNGSCFKLEEAVGPSEDVMELKPIQTSTSLDSNGKVESAEQQDNDKLSDDHNLPDSPFTSPHKPFSPPPVENPSKSLAVGPRSGPPGFAAPSPRANSLNCRICKDFYVDPVQLDCGHAFCVECILKVIRVSKEECPICQRHMGSQIVKLMEARRLQVADICYKDIQAKSCTWGREGRPPYEGKGGPAKMPTSFYYT
ncbi:hypothetical protein GOP47_0002860 [Adiantum capillus-veneris]|uniref:Uncharacterized protein n=1 Tax=Adiantum capillus-veneris TaxID=13818 RepID=A0A9D4VBE9_ADICA|nr:hypothetical protein GOP47_0002860 [Adiantum capillus-veneris]